MSYTNSTPNYALPQWIGTDKPTFLGDFNSAFSAIDTQMKANADASTAATATANSAAATATSANTNATTALNTANSAASEAASATSAAASATSTANTASTDAAAALRASAANSIENLAPAYDPTLTYSVGDLVTFIDDQNSGKLYKCIVAVNSPMEFNINYWDDVTTSEVYKKTALPVRVNNDNYTIIELFNQLYSQISDYTYDMLLGRYIHLSNGALFKFDRLSSGDMLFSAVGSEYSSTVAIVNIYSVRLSTNSKYFAGQINHDITTDSTDVRFEDYSTTTSPTTNTYIELI